MCDCKWKDDRCIKYTRFLWTVFFRLTPPWRRSLSYWSQSTDLQSISMDWFLYDRDPCHESVKDRVYDSVFIRKNTGKRKPLIWYDLRIGYQHLQYRSKIFFGDAFKYNIQFCPPERLNKSLVFSSIISFKMLFRSYV